MRHAGGYARQLVIAILGACVTGVGIVVVVLGAAKGRFTVGAVTRLPGDGALTAVAELDLVRVAVPAGESGGARGRRGAGDVAIRCDRVVELRDGRLTAPE